MLDQPFPLLHIAETVRPQPGHRLLFVFDTLMDESRIRELCPDARLVMTAKLMNRRLIFTKAGTATITPGRNHEVHGVVWEIEEAGLAGLDTHMGIAGLHDRRGAFARAGDGRLIVSEHYWCRDCRPGEPDPGEVLRVVELAKRLQFPIAYAKELLNWLGRAIH